MRNAAELRYAYPTGAALHESAPVGTAGLRADDSQVPATAVDPFERRAIAAVRSGDPSAYGYLVSKYMKRTLSIAWGIVRNAADAEDLAQDAFVKAYEKIDRFREGEPFGPWVYRIVTNLSLDVLKHRRRFPDEPLDSAVAERTTPATDPANVGVADRIDRAIESLPEMQRVVARLYLVEEFSHAEIAAMIGLSEGTVRSHLWHGRKKLQEMLGDLQEEGR